MPTTPVPDSRFAATRWSIVLAAGDWRAGTAARRAMGELARQYWFPLYAFLRRRGQEPVAAEDAVQGVFARVFERRWALAVLEQVLARLRGEYEARGQAELFAALEQGLVGGEKAQHAQA